MREFSTPAVRVVGKDENLANMVWANVEQFPATVSFRRLVNGSWLDVTTNEFAEQVLGVSKGIIAAGLQPGERVGLMSKTRYEWTLLNYAIWAAGCVTVPIYHTSSAGQVEWILADSSARAVVVETSVQHSMVNEIQQRLPELGHVWQVESRPVDEPGAVTKLIELGRQVPDEEVHIRRQAITADNTAALIYTSGTTGSPKGCVITHRNFLAEAYADYAGFPHLLQRGASILMFLPMAHVMAYSITVTCVYFGVIVGHTADLEHLAQTFASFRPTWLPAVPRVCEKIYNAAHDKAGAGLKKWIFDAADVTAVAYSRAKDHNAVNGTLRCIHGIFDKLVYATLRSALGGRCIAIISGGAPFEPRLAHFFRGVGITVFEGYGLTETSAAAVANTVVAYKVGTVGRPFAGVSIRIAEDNEILIKGEIVSPGYWNNDQRTRESYRDGWFYSGDLGALDDEGFLRITGRKKEIIVTAGGKNVAPTALEDRLRAHPLISQCMVVGDRRPFIGALITIDRDFFLTWKRRHNKATSAKIADLVNDSQLRAEIQAAIDQANQAVSRAEGIKKFRILGEDFTEAAGELTPSMKLKRDVISARYADDIAAIYEQPATYPLP